MPVRVKRSAWARAVQWGAAGWVLAGAAAHAQAPKPSDFQVQLWASSCMSCHGPGGKAVGTGLAIGGKPAQELYNKLLGYKNGKLPATVMHQHAKGYSDEELSRIADHFASLK
jgi:cytochrome c553